MELRISSCSNPFMKDSMAYGCGQCIACRNKKRKEWTSRIILEAMAHGDAAFVTLTYNDENLPKYGTLVPEHAKDWQKRIRYYAKERINADLRFFTVGEYGEQTQRPHYHAIVFGLPIVTGTSVPY